MSRLRKICDEKATMNLDTTSEAINATYCGSIRSG